MELSELKKALHANIKISLPLIFIDKLRFLSRQYIEAIALAAGKPLAYIEDLKAIPSKDNLFVSYDDCVYVYICDTLTQDLPKDCDICVITTKIDDNIRETITSPIITVPTLESWQITEYAYTKGEGISKVNIDWLLELCKDNIYRLDFELNKFLLFEKGQRDQLFKLFVTEGMYDDLTSFSSFSLANALIIKDFESISQVLSELHNIELSPMGFISLLYNNFTNVINIQLNPTATAESLGMSSKQFIAIKYRINKYTREQLISILDFLTSLDLKLKQGFLPIDIMIEYVVLKIISFCDSKEKTI